MERVTTRVKDLTASVGKAVLSTTKTAQRRAFPSPGPAGGRPHSSASSSEEGAAPPPPRQEIQDAYGFTLSVTEQQLAVLAACEAAQQRARDKWAQYPQEGGLPPKDRLKRLCRKGVPPELRRWVWVEVSGAAERRRAHHPSYYSAMLQLGKHESPFVHQIQLDVPRTYPNNAWVQSAEGQESLGRVLFAFARHKPDVGYCQGLNYIAALLLLALGRDEETAFWVLACLIDDEDHGILYPDMYAHDLNGTHVEMRSLRALVEAKLPRLAAHLGALQCDMSLLATDWFLCLFCTALPPESATRVWDALLSEGPKVLFRVALALLKLGEGALLAEDNPGDVLRAARRVAAEAHDRDALMKIAIEGVGSMPMGTIRRHRERKQREVDREFAARETRAALRSAVQQGYLVQESEAELLAEAEAASGVAPGVDHLPQQPVQQQPAQLAAEAAQEQGALVEQGQQLEEQQNGEGVEGTPGAASPGRRGGSTAGSAWRAQLQGLGRRLGTGGRHQRGGSGSEPGGREKP